MKKSPDLAVKTLARNGSNEEDFRVKPQDLTRARQQVLLCEQPWSVQDRRRQRCVLI